MMIFMEQQQIRRKKMSVTVSNCAEICNSPTNQSKAKMLYSFSKSPRFTLKKQFYCDKFYHMPHNQSRATSLGLGHKFDFTKQVSKSPPPTAYIIKSEFQKNPHKGTAFGEGREEMKITGPFVATQKNKNPGPGAYPAKSTLSKLSYSMNGKNLREDKQKPRLPGPGVYEALYSINEKGKYYLTKYKNSNVRHFDDSIQRDVMFKNMAPGPGKYDTSKQEFSPEGKYVMSRMKNVFVRKFGKSQRQPLSQKSVTPGPGNYRMPSEFGHYISKTAPGCEREKKPKQENKENKKQ